MAFEPIAPFRATVRDQIAASLLISFWIGSWWMRLNAVVLLLVGIGLFGLGLWCRSPLLISLAPLWALYVFVGRPAVRGMRAKDDLSLSCEAGGLLLESPCYRTIVKWRTITKAVRIGPRLLLMVNGRQGLVVSTRQTTAANFAAIEATVRENVRMA